MVEEPSEDERAGGQQGSRDDKVVLGLQDAHDQENQASGRQDRSVGPARRCQLDRIDQPLADQEIDAVTLDVSARVPGPLTADELEPHLDKIRRGDIVFLYSNNGRNWGSEGYWTGWSYPDADASRALIQKGISAIGFDGPSADPVESTTFDLHRIWLGAGRLIIENATNLDELPERAQVVVAPLKVRAANGAPARIFALLPD